MTRGPVFENNYRVHWLATCASIAAPTVAEITGGTYMGRVVTKDGVALGISQNRVDVASIDETFDAQRMGSWSASPKLTMFRDDALETDGWDLIANGTIGFLLICPWQATPGTEAIGDFTYVFPAEMGVTMPVDSAANAPQQFSVEFAVTSEPNLDGIIAA